MIIQNTLPFDETNSTPTEEKNAEKPEESEIFPTLNATASQVDNGTLSEEKSCNPIDRLDLIRKAHDICIDKRKPQRQVTCILCNEDFPLKGKYMHDICPKCRQHDKELKALRARYHKNLCGKCCGSTGGLSENCCPDTLKDPTLKDIK